MLEIRKIKEDQIDILLDLIYKMAEYEKLRHEVTASKDSLFKSIFVEHTAMCELLYCDDKIAGYLLYFYNFSSFTGYKNLYIEDIFVLEEYRRQGFGKACFKFLAQKAIDENLDRIDWICLDWNQKSLDFYKSMGAKNLDFWCLHRLDKEAIKALVEKE